MKQLLTSLTALLLVSGGCTPEEEPEATIRIDLARRGADIPTSMYGIFFEEINHAGDGGLYAELIQNRGFEDSSVPEGYTVKGDRIFPPADRTNHLTGARPHPDLSFRWNPDPIPAWRFEQLEGSGASAELTREYPLNEASPTALKVTLPEKGRIALSNCGFWGMNIEKGKGYYLRMNTSNGNRFEGRAILKLVAEDGTELCNRPLAIDPDRTWCEYTGQLTATGSDPHARFVIELEGTGTLLLDYVSLFPETFRNRINGLRNDIAQTLEALHPAFVRWPGGCIVEGIDLSNRIEWKKTIGDPKNRPGIYDTWGYRATMGFGYHEFLQFCEDIGAAGMFVCNAGIGCQGRVGDACREEDLDAFIQDALDAIDYALGDGTTEWSRKRVENGHPEPFPLQYVEIGNENWGPVYEKRYDRFYRAIKAKYPRLTLISTLGLGGQHRHERVDMIDPHWYFEQPRNGVQVSGRIGLGGWNTDNEYRELKVTLPDGRVIEADMERGWTPKGGTWSAADGTLSQEGPGVMRWSIWDSPEEFSDCSISVKARKKSGDEGFILYFGMQGETGYVLNIGGWSNQTTAFQHMVGADMPQIPNNIAQQVETGRWYDIRIDIHGDSFTYSLDGKRMLEARIEQSRQYVVSGYDETTGEEVIKFVNATEKPFTARIELAGAESVGRTGKAIVLTSGDPSDENSLDNPEKVVPEERVYKGFSDRFTYTFDPWSFTVLRIKVQK